MSKNNLKLLKIKVQNEIKKSENLKELNEIFKKYLGKRGKLTQIFSSIKNLPETKRVEFGKRANQVKKEITNLLEKKRQKLLSLNQKLKEEWFDITAPGKKIEKGHLHPITQLMRKAVEIFERMGFSVVEGPEIETEWYNFDALNFPDDHPAKEMQDTLFVKQKNRKNLSNRKKLLMRTHTSPVQIRFMEKNNPPLRIVVPGRVFRREATDASHEINFYQLEGLMIGKDISVANFKAIIKEFFQRFFQKDIKIRLRPGFFPFVEPGFEVDINCLNCQSKGCSVCSKTGWVELIGAGMVHPNVLKNSGLNPKDWQGFAFGVGFDRLVMMKYKIDDIRLFYSGDLRFLNQF